MDLHIAYSISLSFLLFSAFVSGLELSSAPALYIDFLYPSTNTTNKHRFWVHIHIGQALLSICVCFLFFLNHDYAFKFAFISLTGLNLYSYRIRKAGKDGSDQLRLLALLSFSICLILEDEYSKLIPITFIGIQVVIAYTTSGLAKLLSKHWRRGNVLSGILSTYSYGIPEFSRFLIRRPLLEKGMSYMAILVMLAVPLTFILPFQTPLIIALTAIAGFHFATAIFMGLNDFLYTFPMAYPGIIILHTIIFK